MIDHIGVYAHYIACPLGGLIKSLSFLNNNLYVFSEEKCKDPCFEHQITYPLVKKLLCDRLISFDEAVNIEFDLLIVPWSHSYRYTHQQLLQLIRALQKSRRSILFYDGNFGSKMQRLKQQLSDRVSYNVIFSNIEEVCYFSQAPELDILSLGKRRFSYKTSPNNDYYYSDETLCEMYEDYDCRIGRKYTISMTGAKGNVLRQKVAIEAEEYFKSNGIFSLDYGGGINHKEGITERRVVYFGCPDQYLSVNDYFTLLTESDFCLCLPGDIWTFRPIDALARGAIPILGNDYLHAYDFPWRNELNCIIVKSEKNPQSWKEALEKVASLSENEILHMRSEIHRLRDTHLKPEEYRKRLYEEWRIC